MGSLPYIGDASSNAHTATFIGTPSTKPFGPYDNNVYAAADHGGSMLFEGGDYLSIADHNDFNLTSDFTIKFWAWVDVPYSWGGNVTYGLFDNYTYNNGGLRLCINGAGLYNGKLVLYWGSGWDAVGVEQFNFIPEKDQWYYYELTRSGNTLTVKVNGESVGTVNVTNLANPTTSLIIGTNTGNGGGSGSGTYNINNYLYGYMSDFQYITGGTASESTVPTAPMSTDTNSKLHIKGTDASIIDKSQGANLELVGNTTGSTAQVKFVDSKSMYFDGTGDYINTNSNIQDAIGTAEYTAEAWIYCTSIANRSIFGSGTSDAADEFGLYLLSNGQIYHDIGGAYDYVQSSSSITVNTWHHLAITRTSSRIDIWLDGTSVGSTTNTNIAGIHISGNSDFKIGHGRLGYWSGYIQEARLRIGKAEYTSTFTPPTAPFEG